MYVEYKGKYGGARANEAKWRALVDEVEGEREAERAAHAAALAEATAKVANLEALKARALQYRQQYLILMIGHGISLTGHASTGRKRVEAEGRGEGGGCGGGAAAAAGARRRAQAAGGRHRRAKSSAV